MDEVIPTPLIGDPRRQAHATIAAFDYQLWLTVHAWMKLKDGEWLYVEGAEDFDAILGDTASTTQVKAGKSPLTLNSAEVRKAIGDFWRTREANPDRDIRYVFLTQAAITNEKQRAGLEPLLNIWRRGARSEEDLQEIRETLRADFELPLSLRQFLEAYTSEEIRQKLILKITWSTESSDTQTVERLVEEALVLHGEKLGVTPSSAKKVAPSLLQEVTKAARTKEAAPLHRAGLLELFESLTKPDVSIGEMQALRIALARRQPTLHENPQAEISIARIRRGPPPLGRQICKRASVVGSYASLVRTLSTICIHGSTGMGKTTIANLTLRNLGGNWLWWTGRKVDGDGLRFALRALRHEIDSIEGIDGIVLDDVDFSVSNASCIEEELADLVFQASCRCLMIVITSQRPPSLRLYPTLNLQAGSVCEVKSLSPSDVVEMASSLGCVNVDSISKFGSVIISTTAGHPQLVHAQLLALQRESWSDTSLKRLCSLKAATGQIQAEARALINDLPKNECQMLARLSIVRCPFTRTHALRLSEEEPEIADAGFCLDLLIGPWVESLHEGYFRVSPLVEEMGTAMLSPTMLHRLHSGIVAALWSPKMKDFEVAAALNHAWSAKNAFWLARISASFSGQPKDVLKAMAPQLHWFILEALGAKDVLSNVPGVSLMLRVLQFRLAAAWVPKIAGIVFLRIEQEYAKIPQGELRDEASLMVGSLPWMCSEQTVDAGTMIRCLSYVQKANQRNTSEFKSLQNEQQEGDDHRKWPISSARDLGFLTSFWCSSVKQLAEWIDALESTTAEARKLWYTGISKTDTTVNLLVERAWLHESDEPTPNWDQALDVLGRLAVLATKFEWPKLRVASIVGQAVILQEYLSKLDDAEQLIQSELTLSGFSNPYLLDRLARLAGERGDSNAALNLWRKVIANWATDDTEFTSRKAFVYIQSAREAGRVEDFSAAAAFLEDASTELGLQGQKDLLIGVKADLGFVYFRQNILSKAFENWVAALTLIEKRDLDSDELHAFAVRKAVGHIITWVFGTVWSKGSPLSEPSIGFASGINPDLKMRDLGETDWSIVWLNLIGIGIEFGEGRAMTEAMMPRLLASKSLKVLALALMMEVHSCLAYGTLQDFPEKLQAWNSALSAAAVEARKSGSFSGPEPEAGDSEDLYKNGILAALLIFFADGASPAWILGEWQKSLSKLSADTGGRLLKWIDEISICLNLPTRDAVGRMAVEVCYFTRGILALRLCCEDQLPPSDTALTQYRLLITMNSDPAFRRRTASKLAALIIKPWRKHIKNPALLSLPSETVPRLLAAIDSSEKGFAKARSVVLAGIRAAGLSFDNSLAEQLNRIKE